MNAETTWRRLKPHLWITDFGFLLYWLLTALTAIPPEYAFKDYQNPVLVAWNWSFLPLDMLASLTGLGALLLSKRYDVRPLLLLTLTLTHVAGLNAIAFWVITRDFSWQWWVPNVYLMLFPLLFIVPILKSSVQPVSRPRDRVVQL
ncbi:DUF5360 family protein [Deinococcus oregonensis]|uniref:DUF5360 family protein n=1 Tax=Deinococcus oregonensis TaxID=1805970 RepID=A0ABV6B4W7_9DEIO